MDKTNLHILLHVFWGTHALIPLWYVAGVQLLGHRVGTCFALLQTAK